MQCIDVPLSARQNVLHQGTLPGIVRTSLPSKSSVRWLQSQSDEEYNCLWNINYIEYTWGLPRIIHELFNHFLTRSWRHFYDEFQQDELHASRIVKIVY